MSSRNENLPAPKPQRVELRVARLVKAHGLKGGLKLELYTDDPELRFRPGAVLSLQVPTDSPWFGRNLTVSQLRFYNSHAVAFFEGVEDRDAAEGLVKAILWVSDDAAARPEEDDAWFDHQLVGVAVWRDGADVGRVARVDHLPAQDLLAITVHDGSEVLLPFVKQFVPEVDIDAGRIVITPPGGLFDSAPEDEAEPEEGAAE
jgi:16S rRNA processing protein RimM